MKTRLILLAAAAAVAAPSVAAAAWTRTYAVEWYEPAMYYGAKTGVIDPGTDCPKGTNPEVDWVAVLMKAGYTEEEARWLRNPANPTRSAVHGQNQMAFRGKDRANIYVHPESTPDPGLLPMVGKIAEGIDLDGNPKTGLISPTGEKGIDNVFYKTLGCWKTYRGPPRKSSGALQFNDSMREGAWTVVVVMSGEGTDPMNDDRITLGLYMSPDKLVKDGAGNVAADYTFRIQPHAKFEAVFKGRVKDGRITTEATPEIWMRDPGYAREVQLLQAKADLRMQPDGTLKGYVGGYRPWEPVYKGWVNARGPVIESLTWVQLPAVWYALKRSADYAPAPGAEKSHISFAFRVDAVPAYVAAPEGKALVTAVQSYKAMAPKADGALAAATGGIRVVDGIVVPRGQAAVSQTPEQLRPPVSVTTTASAGGGGQR
jgi:hypothetical protein